MDSSMNVQEAFTKPSGDYLSWHLLTASELIFLSYTGKADPSWVLYLGIALNA